MPVRRLLTCDQARVNIFMQLYAFRRRIVCAGSLMADVQVGIYLAIAINYRCGGLSVAAQAGKLLSEGTRNTCNKAITVCKTFDLQVVRRLSLPEDGALPHAQV